jgi:hypothetical protein
MFQSKEHLMLLTDAEQRKLNDEIDGPTTQKINKKLSEAEQRILLQLRPVVEQIQEHDGVLNFFARKLGVKRRAA